MSSNVDPQLVRHIGRLSRIALSEQEVETFGPQLGAVVEYFDKLNELDTENVQPMAHAVEIHNVLAEDTLGESLTPDQALANAPAREGDFFRVPKILGEGS